jgi:probable HAF family extracellular repeat protein
LISGGALNHRFNSEAQNHESAPLVESGNLGFNSHMIFPVRGHFNPVAIAIALTLLAARPAHATINYVATDLGLLNSDDQSSQGYGINNYGQVAGSAPNSQAVPHVFLWTPSTPNGTSGAMIDLGLCSSGFDGGFKLNSYGQMQFNRGVSTPSFGVQSHAFLWTPSTPNSTTGSTVDLLTLNGADGASYGYGINDLSAVVGVSYPGDCFIWTPVSPNAMTEMMTDFGNSSSSGVAFGVNNSGQVTGYVGVKFFSYPIIHAGLVPYSTSDIIGPGPQANPNDQSYSGTGYAINAAGHVAGDAVLPNPASLRPFLFTGGGRLTDLAGDGHAAGINNRDQVVGDINNNAYLFANGTNYNLLSLLDGAAGWNQLVTARAINDAGQIVGYGSRNGDLHAYLLTPVEMVLRITAIIREGTNIRLTWQTIGGTTNQIQVAGNNFNFTDLGSPIIINGTGSSLTNYVEAGETANGPARFYRISLIR